MHRLGELRTIKDAELELMLSWRNALAVRKNMYTQHKISLNEHLSWWDRIRTRVDQKYFMYEIDGKPCGIVAFNKIDLHNKNSSWAFYASPHAAKGTGSRMEFLALEYAFSELSLHKLNCEVLAFNIPVIKLHQKFGLARRNISHPIYQSLYSPGENYIGEARNIKKYGFAKKLCHGLYRESNVFWYLLR